MSESSSVEASKPRGSARGRTLCRCLSGAKTATLPLKVGDITQRMVANIAPVLIDLLEIATYVYCADC